MGKSSTSFKKGHKPVSPGRPKLPDDIKAARKMSLETFMRDIMEIIAMSAEDVKKTDMEKMSLGKRAILNAFAKNDHKAIKDFQDRLWGKAQESVDITTNSEVINKIEFIGIRSVDKDSSEDNTDN